MHIPLEELRNIYQSHALDLLWNCLCLDKMTRRMKTAWSTSDDFIKNALFMPRLAICSRDLHWHWINRTLLCHTMEVSMLSRAWLTIAQHVFQPALTGRPELISRKIVSGEPRTKAIAVSRFREKLSPANWVQGVTAISRKISRSSAPKKWGPTCDRDISNSAIYTTAIYRAYTVLLYSMDFMVLGSFEIHWIGQYLVNVVLCGIKDL